MDDQTREQLIEEEKKKMRRLRFLVDLTVNVLYQDSSLTLEDARELVRNTEKAVLNMFPGKRQTFSLLLLPRFERIMYERWGRGMDSRVQ